MEEGPAVGGIRRRPAKLKSRIANTTLGFMVDCFFTTDIFVTKICLKFQFAFVSCQRRISGLILCKMQHNIEQLIIRSNFLGKVSNVQTKYS